MPLRLAIFRTADELANYVNDRKTITAVAVVDGGAGYTLDDVLTVVGEYHTVGKLLVDWEEGGVIDTAIVEEAGVYLINPTNPVSVRGGTGSGATFNLTLTAAAIDQTDIISIEERSGSWYLQFWE